MRKGRIIFIVVAIAMLSGTLYVYREYNRPNKILAEVDAAIKISGSELLASFAGNDSLANIKYLGKVVEIDGIIKNVEMPENNVSIIVVGGHDAMSSVRCTMDSSFKRESFLLDKGAAVNIKGFCTGYNEDELIGSDVLLNKCIIVLR